MKNAAQPKQDTPEAPPFEMAKPTPAEIVLQQFDAQQTFNLLTTLRTFQIQLGWHLPVLPLDVKVRIAEELNSAANEVMVSIGPAGNA